jgi:hypothetical protein
MNIFAVKISSSDNNLPNKINFFHFSKHYSLQMKLTLYMGGNSLISSNYNDQGSDLVSIHHGYGHSP